MITRSPSVARSLSLALALTACSGERGGDADGDAGGDTEADAGGSAQACPADVHARFEVYLLDDLPAVLGEYDDLPGIGLGLETEDGCRTGTIPDNDDGGDGDPGGRQAMDIGVVRITGTEPDLELMATDDNLYRSAYAEYVPGAEIGVSGGGMGSGVEPFAIDVVAVPELTAASTTYTVAQGEDLVIRWDQADSPAGTRIWLYAVTSGADQDFIECWWGDTGQATVPAAQLDGVLPASDSFSIVALTRIDHATTETERGCAALETWTRLRLDIGR